MEERKDYTRDDAAHYCYWRVRARVSIEKNCEERIVSQDIYVIIIQKGDYGERIFERGHYEENLDRGMYLDGKKERVVKGSGSCKRGEARER